jgi:hypothetical protein
LISKYGPIRQCNDLIDLIDCDVGPWQVAAPLRRLLSTTLGYGHGLCPPSAWNDSWDDAQNNPSAAGAVSAIACAIVAVSACAVCEHTSCKRQVIDSDPGGSQQARLAFFVVA